MAALGTITGKLLDVLDIKPEDINAYDIAWSLHNTNRYAGHTSVPWDVLSHTGLVYTLYVWDMRGSLDPNYSKALLLHDAAEAYIGDMIGGLKDSPVGEAFRDLERKILRTVFQRFGLNLDDIDWVIVDRYDHQAAHVEIRKFYPHLVSDPKVVQAQYPMERYPIMGVAKVPDYIELLKNLCINSGVQDIGSLFEIPDHLTGLLREDSSTQAAQSGAVTTIEVRETASVENMTV